MLRGVGKNSNLSISRLFIILLIYSFKNYERNFLINGSLSCNNNFDILNPVDN